MLKAYIRFYHFIQLIFCFQKLNIISDIRTLTSPISHLELKKKEENKKRKYLRGKKKLKQTHVIDFEKTKYYPQE